jgi:hypothetical protein
MTATEKTVYVLVGSVIIGCLWGGMAYELFGWVGGVGFGVLVGLFWGCVGRTLLPQ